MKNWKIITQTVTQQMKIKTGKGSSETLRIENLYYTLMGIQAEEKLGSGRLTILGRW